MRLRRALILGLVLALGASSAGAHALAPARGPSGLDAPREKQIAMELVSSAENSTLDWRQHRLAPRAGPAVRPRLAPGGPRPGVPPAADA